MKQLTLESQYRKYPKAWPQFIIGAVVVCAIIIIWNITVEFEGFTQRGWSIIGVAMRGLFTPSWKVISDMSSSGLLHMLFETFAIGFLGTVFGTIIAIPFAFISSRNIAPRWVNLIFLVIITLIRAFPSIMYGIMFVKTVGPGAYAGVLTMTIGSVGMLSKLLVESVEDINPGIIEALDAAGCTGFQKVRYGIMPQLSSSIISNVLYRLDINVKNASVLGLVGAGGIGAQLIFAIQDRRWSDAGAMLWGLVILVLLIEYISTRIRNSLAGKS
ncbi:MAG: phosphonate ABC transporter, permease protein PhnE [Clostridiales bacterium]|nr:phosphonate ABC transporter, permease protein PhnE [Clostridiales bacterium]